MTLALGITKFLKVGPCRLIPHNKINLGFFLLTLNIATCLIWKGITTYMAFDHPDIYDVMLWISVTILPRMAFVSSFLPHIIIKIWELVKERNFI